MKPISIYIHIPFCEKKCAYCDFVSFDNKSGMVDEYIDTLCKEIKGEKIEHAGTIFIGGGTPSLLTNNQISKIFELLPKASEITIEANPNSITAEKLRHWRKLGINRISIGVQSFDNETLKMLGRIHTAEQATSAIELAYKSGFRNINIDLIHSVIISQITIPSEVFDYVTHVSAYCLIIEEGKPFTPIQDTESIKQQKQIERILNANGLKKYEVSNFAKNGFECKHNMAYWQPQTHEYIGFGLAAHSFYNNTRFSNTANLDTYINQNIRTIQEHDMELETVMLGLRTVYGVEISMLGNKSAEIELLKSLKLVKVANNRIVATNKGFFMLNSIIEKLI